MVGLGVPDDRLPDFAAVMERMRRVRARISHEDSAKRYSEEFGIDVFLGQATFRGADRLDVDGTELRSLLYNGKVLTVELPTTVDLEVVDTAPALKGATAQAQMKPATLETGLEILVPPYLVAGERVKVDTRDSSYLGRVKG